MKPQLYQKRFRKKGRFEAYYPTFIWSLQIGGRHYYDKEEEEDEEVCRKRLLRPYPLKGGSCVSRSLRFSYALVQPRKRPLFVFAASTSEKKKKKNFPLFLEAGNSLSFHISRIE